ncbi:CvpA family protein [Psychrobacillus sp. NEAU-3TGS]|uniref:CvpA family protein n=1 Tax=Psychrobacillus sp. NEAU-3TGS TaxID=2995412 RepID=UPI0024970828|nr:CvpA family protein [Psychrobacillus sp. NEAU-3TGS]MDI2588314.1 CvpA family protein [Psychrobacillus sp. NEAU-3TGS]
MLDILILILLVAGLITGAKRGLIVQLIHMTGFIIALFVAYTYYKPLADKFVLWIPFPAITAGSKLTIAVENLELDQTFYRVIAFVLIFIAVKLVLQLIASMFDFLKYLPILGFVSNLVGAVLGFIEFYFILFVLLYVCALLPIDFIQNLISNSILTGWMLEHTPILSELVKNWWYIYIEK